MAKHYSVNRFSFANLVVEDSNSGPSPDTHSIELIELEKGELVLSANEVSSLAHELARAYMHEPSSKEAVRKMLHAATHTTFKVK